LIDGLTQNIENSPQGSRSNRNRNRLAQIDAIQSTHQTIGATQRDTSHSAATKVLLNFACQIQLHPFGFAFDLDRVVNRGQLALWEFCVKRRADNLTDSTDVFDSADAHISLD
jgi:hypothetical protein